MAAPEEQAPLQEEEEPLDPVLEMQLCARGQVVRELRLSVDPNVVQKYEHVMCFKPDTPPLHVDEIATSWFGKVFDKRAEDDTTGIQIWAASLVMAYWIVDLAPELDGKRVCELGAGCGLPALATLAYSDAKQVVMTDVFEPTLENLRANVKRNGDNNSMASRAAVHCLDWTKPETYRIDPDVAVDQQFDVLLGCDLIYDNALVQPLINTIRALLPVGGTFYYVSGGKRFVFI
ncbi:uncharacterized protein MONBRDRAFT_10114 [Monosiga brevicollis MX1]|uniref:Uncharacterized protein n=1 Tax=Monosiga brevicollis TaxID=81824 RepID=A9V594_MONBE|nr:uncharacterized protein MONBRDRAFT_10114 [Monosiga brevicollis MX1]EDQ87338.1 predicted protein [Monosiga brevicollis MX1]|eukprot:XP_001747951.1 hypothetical protein [Monosiga brevicollis MX1]